MILGVDPGLTGAIALLTDNGAIVWVEDMPVIDGDVSSTLLAHRLRWTRITTAVVERVASMPGQGVSSVFKFGKGYGQVLGVLSALEIPVIDPTPSQWKREMSLNNDKERSRALAVKTWPKHADDLFKRKKDNGRAEAALLALWYLQRNPVTPSSMPSTGRTLRRRS